MEVFFDDGTSEAYLILLSTSTRISTTYMRLSLLSVYLHKLVTTTFGGCGNKQYEVIAKGNIAR